MCQQTIPESRQCVVCNKALHGRSDKRFCDINCKNFYHSEIRKSMRTIQSETLKVLTKNYLILAGIMHEKPDAYLIDKQALEEKGFKFNYVTDASNLHGGLRFSVFEFNYRFAHNRRVLVTVDKKNSSISPYLFKRWEREIRERPS